MSTQSPTITVSNQPASNNPTAKPSMLQYDDGARQLSWIIVALMMVFATLVVVSYQEPSIAIEPAAKQTIKSTPSPAKVVNAPAAAKEAAPAPEETSIHPEKMGRGELISA